MSVTTNLDHFILIMLSMLVAFVPRYFPMKIFASRQIPNWFNEWMKYVPVSLFTALVVKDVFMNTETYEFIGFDSVAKIIASVIVMAVAYFSRSMGLAVVVGLIAVAVLSLVVPI